MATPLTILFADDQLPCDHDADNQRVRAEIRREFAVAKPGLDVDSAFAEDQAWFSGLLSYLEQTKGETVIRVRHFDEASARLAQAQDVDVAIVDLSWWGDARLPAGAGSRENRGLKLLPDAQANAGPRVPMIVLSQNFTDNFELMSTVLERGALPVPKNYQAKDLGYRTLYAAVQYLAGQRRRSPSATQLFISHAHADQDLALGLTRVLELGLDVPPGAIRCSSVPGYDLPPGSDFAQTLRQDLAGARCVIGLWTDHSLASQWCLFELGAAWGLAQRTLLLCQDAQALRDPPAGFRSILGTQLSDPQQLRRFLAEVESITGWGPRNRLAAEREMSQLAQAAARPAGR